ncbi:hypothetical protein JOB18_013738 [Solea senegalensis]|uniref:Uncharacterized protein n=1 Tax=Solea senegalensis TaxID=28829 RepID=A0AAV6S7Q1_SOLSE|nr:hypothetical protein JOB18_013738 [Solea senegalensis]
MTTMTSLQGLAQRRQRSSRQTAWATAGAARRPERTGCRIENAWTTAGGKDVRSGARRRTNFHNWHDVTEDMKI